MYALIIPLRPLANELLYKVNIKHEKEIKAGIRVLVPLGNSKTVGLVKELYEKKPESAKEDKYTIKEISEILDREPILSETMFELFYWLKEYYFFPLGEIIKTALPNMLSKPKALDIDKRLTKAAKKKRELFEIEESNTVINLNPDQEYALQEINKSIRETKNDNFLLHGMTGSGKTEIYLRAVKQCIEEGKEALLLVPEISLTPQLISRLKRHFGEDFAIFHSALTDLERLQEWLKIKTGTLKIAVGVRSAIFLPFNNLGLIIVDEEHELTFKQSERLKYNARDLAILRGKFEKAVVILGSATPSLETYYKAKTGGIRLLSLKSKACQTLPVETEIVALRKKNTFKETLFSNELYEQLKENLNNGFQSLLFLNRTGFSNFVICKSCGYSFKCPDCSISLTYYRSNDDLKCSYCDYKSPFPTECPVCKNQELSLMGSGTEKIENDILKYFPSSNVERMDRFTTEKKNSREELIQKLSEGKIDILVGTQMIAKGFDFHKITLAAVILADGILSIPDFRSSERAFQLIAQVAGRSGRGVHKGKVIIQAYNTDHYAIQYAKNEDYVGFYEEEIKLREALRYPPFVRLINIRFSGNNENEVYKRVQSTKLLLVKYASMNNKWRSISIMGPAPELIFKVRNKYRYHILLKHESPIILNALMKTVLKNHYKDLNSKGVQLIVDVDPINLN